MSEKKHTYADDYIFKDALEANDNALYENSSVKIIDHRHRDFAEHSYIAIPKRPDKNFPTFLQNSTCKELSEIFNAITECMQNRGTTHDAEKLLWIVNCRNDAVEKNHTHARFGAPHINVLAGSEKPDFSFIKTQKSYCPSPKLDFHKAVQEPEKYLTFAGRLGSFTTYKVKEDMQESPKHLVIVNPLYKTFAEFASQSDPSEFIALKNALLWQIRSMQAQGGVRLVCDDLFHPTGALTIHLYGGELEKRWFDHPDGPSNTPQPKV